MHPGIIPIFQPASAQVGEIAHLFTMVLVICGGILAIVTGLVIYCAIFFRRKEGAAEPRQIFGQKKLEIVWTAVPVCILIVFFILTVKAVSFSDPPADQKPDLIVIGHQWWWEVRYPNLGITTANEVHIPAGKKLLVLLKSADVIHDFWVPQLAHKMDMVPGHPNHIWLEADTPGTYQGSCGEFCGAQHAWMRFVVIADTEAQFADWTKQQLEPSPNPSGAAALHGEQTFNQMVCASCHSLSGVSTNKYAAPDLSHLADRQTLGAGVLENTPENLALWLKNPAAIKPGCRMPNLKLTGAQVTNLVDFLEPRHD
jgi:cytochrome c oxidase subunit 2